LVTVDNSPAPTIEIPAFEAALELGNKVVTNVIIMGVLQEITEAVSKESLEKALMSSIPKGYEELNKNALYKGYEIGAQIKGGMN
jgi:2-oxoglutarate ferredoxin oxidoreductase subunit gamma